MRSRPAWLALALTGALCSVGCSEGGDDPVPDAGGNPNPNVPTAAPLPKTSFVFTREVRPGAKHVMAYDVATGQERLVSALDDDGQTAGTGGILRLDVSPDRRRIAFTANYRLDERDSANPAQIVWTMNADGTGLARVTPPLPNPFTTSCTNDYGCVSPERCYGGWCKKPSFSTEILDPEYTPDGRTIFFSMGQTWLHGTTIEGGVGVNSVPSAGGEIAFYNLQGDCQTVSAPAVNARGNQLAVLRAVCLSSGDGVYSLPVPVPVQSGAGTRIVGESASFYLGSAKPFWWGDANGDTGLLFIGTDYNSMQGSGVLSADFASNQMYILYEPAAGNAESFSVSPDYKSMVVCVMSESGSDLFYVADLQNGSAPMRLTTDARSCYPAW